MKKFLLGCLILITACQPATPTPAPVLPPTVPPSPTPVPDTPTPQPTPTLELTPTPFPRLFTDEFDGTLTGWTILQAGSDSTPNVSTQNSNLILNMDAPYTWLYVLYGPQDYDDIRIDTQFVNQAGSPASIGLMCRYSESDGWLEYNVSTDGTYNVLYGKWLASGVADYLPIMSGSSGAIQSSGAVQEIGLICAGSTLSLLVNQSVIRRVDVSHYELTQGKVGIAASSYQNAPVVAAFNWLKVSEP